MSRAVGPTELDQAVIAWLDTHHVRGKDVFAWSGTGQGGEVTTMTISFYVSGVDTVDVRPDTEVGHGVTKVRDWLDQPIQDMPTEQFNISEPRPYVGRPIKDNPQA